MSFLSGAQQRIASVFFLHAFANAMLHTRLPDLQLEAGLNDAMLGLVLMGGPVGSVVAFPFASRAIEQFGTRTVTLIAFLAMLPCVPLMTILPSAASLLVLLAINGIGGTVAAMTFNVEADRIEASLGRRIMNGCHGAWSVGYLVGASIGAGLRGFDISPVVHLWVVMPLILVAVFAIVLTTPLAPARHFQPSTAPRRFALPSLAILALVAVGLGAELMEGASRVWATILMRDTFTVPAWVESSALPALVLTMAVGRLLADRWVDRFGTERVARVLLAIAFVGILAIATAVHPLVVILGFAVAGAGICVIYPLSISAAARLGDRPASQNVAALTQVIQVVMLVAPMGTGLIAESFGVRVAFGTLLPIIALGWLMSRSLGEATGAPVSRESA